MLHRAAAHCIYLYIPFYTWSISRLRKYKVSKHTILQNWSASSSNNTWQLSDSTPLDSAAPAICSICTIFEMESTLWCLERWWLANKGPEPMTSCWMLAATRSCGLNVHSMATQNQSWDNVEACDLQCLISPPAAFMSELPKIYGNEHSFFARSQIRDITACRTWPFIDWKRMPSELLADIVNQTWHKPARWASKCDLNEKTGCEAQYAPRSRRVLWFFCSVNLISKLPVCTSSESSLVIIAIIVIISSSIIIIIIIINQKLSMYITVCVYNTLQYFINIHAVTPITGMKSSQPPRAPCKAAGNHAFSIWDRLFHGRHAVMPVLERMTSKHCLGSVRRG